MYPRSESARVNFSLSVPSCAKAVMLTTVSNERKKSFFIIVVLFKILINMSLRGEGETVRRDDEATSSYAQLRGCFAAQASLNPLAMTWFLFLISFIYSRESDIKVKIIGFQVIFCRAGNINSLRGGCGMNKLVFAAFDAHPHRHVETLSVGYPFYPGLA